MKQILTLCVVILATLSGCKKSGVPLPKIKGSWTLVSSLPVMDRMLSTGTGLIAYSSSNSGPVYYSNDHGVTWVLKFGSPSSNILLYPDLMNNSRVIAYSYSDSTLYLSNDGGNSFSSLEHPITFGYRDKIPFVGVAGNRLFAIHVQVDSTISGPLIKSDDLGHTWDTVSPVFANDLVLGEPVLIPINNSIFIFTISGAIYKSLDTGSTWTIQNASSPVINFGGQMSNGNIIGTSPYDIYKSPDFGMTWSSIYNNSKSNDIWAATVFDSCILVYGDPVGSDEFICSNPNKLKWYSADVSGQMLVTDSLYVYTWGSGSSNGVSIWRRPKSDFSGL
jgi:hypothetical protein